MPRGVIMNFCVVTHRDAGLAEPRADGRRVIVLAVADRPNHLALPRGGVDANPERSDLRDRRL